MIEGVAWCLLYMVKTTVLGERIFGLTLDAATIVEGSPCMVAGD